jgi:hypothetical protein
VDPVHPQQAVFTVPALLRTVTVTTLLGFSASNAHAASKVDEALDVLRKQCSTDLDEILSRDFNTVLEKGVDRNEFCSCAEKATRADRTFEHIANTPSTDRKRLHPQADEYMDSMFFLAGLDCVLPRPGWNKDGRSILDVKAVFEEGIPSVYAAYRKALQRRPGLQGHAEVVITINAQGKPVNVQIEFLDFEDEQLEEDLRAAVAAFDFGSNSLPSQVVKLPIEFLPD